MLLFAILCGVLVIMLCLWLVITSRQRKIDRVQSSSNIPNLEERENHFDLIDKWVKENKRFTDPLLKLETVSKGLHLSEKQVSEAINTIACQNFKSYINKLRVQEAKEYLTNSGYNHFTNEAFAEMVGFSNKVSFYQSFKKVTGMSPADFRKSSNH